MIDFDAALSIAARPGTRLIAIDGLPVSGKSVLAERFEIELGARCVYLDDFVKPEAAWRSGSAPAFPFGYIRYDEFLDAVKTLAGGGVARYRLYDWATGTLGAYREVPPDAPVVIEGVSSLHPDLAPLYDLRFWVESDATSTLAAALARGTAGWDREWRELFLPSVEIYLRTEPKQRTDYFVAGRGVSP